MNLDQLTLGELKQLRCLLGGEVSSRRLPLEIGKDVFIRSVTHHYVGTVIALSDEEIVLMPCAWVADDGRFGEAMATGKLNEVEVWPKDVPVTVNRGSLCDTAPWKHGVPTASK